MATDRHAQTAAAREKNKHNAALRAIDDPVKLAKYARTVRVALERGRLTAADILPADERAEVAA